MAELASSYVLGLRARKKRRTRQEISDVATRLFAEHGFELVTLAQIAEAAEVSVKTVFNHFGSKEDLYFDRAEEFRHGFLVTVADRPAGVTILGALKALMRDNLVPFPGSGWGTLDDPVNEERFRRFMRVEDKAPALKARRLTLMAELEVELAHVVGRELGQNASPAAVRCFAAMVMAAFAVRDDALREALARVEAPEPVTADQASPEAIRHTVCTVVDEAFERLERAFSDWR